MNHYHLFYKYPNNTLHISIPKFPKLLTKQHKTLKQNINLYIKIKQYNNI